MILLIDNYDSFTWNLVQRLGELDPTLEPGRDLIVARNDRLTPDEAEALDGGRGPSHLIISPGPCTPREAGVSGAMLERFMGRAAVLGVCLGHQCMGAAWGMTVSRHHTPVHGKAWEIHHDGRGVYAGLPSPFTAARYHSLVVDAATVPDAPDHADGWTVSAWAFDADPAGTPQRVIMGLRRRFADRSRAPAEGVQFHPESFLTDRGPRLLANFLAMGPRPRAVATG